MILSVPLASLIVGNEKISDTAQYKTAVEFFENPNMKWDGGTYHRFLKAKVAETEDVNGLWGYIKTEEDIERRVQVFRDLFEEVIEKPDDVLINIYVGDNGELITIDGSHRASILLAMGRTHVRTTIGGENIPWKEMYPEHMLRGYTAKWIQFVDDIRGISGQDVLYHPINHPWFDGWQLIRQCHDRLLKILTVTKKNDRIIDIGCHHGYFNHELCARGFDTVGVDQRKSSIETAVRLNDIYKLYPPFICDDALHYLKQHDVVADIFLFFGIHHHIETSVGFDYLANVLKLMSRKGKKLIMEVSRHDETLNVNNKFCQYMAVDWLLKNTDFEFASLLGFTEHGRCLILFEKKEF